MLHNEKLFFWSTAKDFVLVMFFYEKVKLALEQVIKAQRENTGVALLFL